MKYIMSETMYDELCRVMTDFENAYNEDDNRDKGYRSDGEWLDDFYTLCVEIQRDVLS